MKSFIVLLIFLFIIEHSYSQNINDKNIFSFSVGGSLPVGNYASTNLSYNLAGFAKLGESVNLSFEHKINNHVGLIAMLLGQRNGLNTNAFASQFSKTPFFSGFGPGFPRYYSNWVIDKKNWYGESLLIGGTFELKSDDKSKTSFITKALLGAAYIQSPNLKAYSYSDTSYVDINQTSAAAFGFSYMISEELRYKLTKKISLLICCGYFGTSQINFKNVTSAIAAKNGGINIPKIYLIGNSILPPIITESTSNSKQPVATINLNLGIAFAL